MRNLLAAALAAMAAPAAVEAEHGRNAVYRELIADGIDFGGARIRFPEPRFRDGQDAAAQRAALAELAGGEKKAAELRRDSVTAPFILKVRDEATKEGDPIRLADLVFVVHADFSTLDPAEAARRAAGKVTEVANMRVETTIFPGDAPDAATGPGGGWHSHLSARLLDRIGVESTDRAVISRSSQSLVVASRTDRRYDRDPKRPNLWRPIDRDGKATGPDRPYVGGANYMKISRLVDDPRALLVEAHFAFVEPKAWFDGAPILRSKFAPVAQDQIRRLRREAQVRPE